MKVAELKIVLCLTLLFIIMVLIAFCSNGKQEESQIKNSETTTITDEPKAQQSDSDAQSTETEINTTLTEEVKEDVTTEEPKEETIEDSQNTESQEPQTEILLGSDEFGYDNALMLHKISIAEAGGESVESVALMILVILNRVQDEKFPNSIEEVIFQRTNGVAQFSPIIDGNYNKAQPNEKSHKAMELVLGGWDETQGALYFEACEYGGSWHSTALEFLFEKDGIRYYK